MSTDSLINEAVERLIVEVPSIDYPPPNQPDMIDARKRLLKSCIIPILQSLAHKLQNRNTSP